MKSFLLVFLISLFGFVGTADASTKKEKAELSRLVGELKYLKHDVLQISELRRADDTEAFNYEALLSDLEAVELAVERHINNPSRQPKKLQPLKAEYGNIH